jgi:hypothetical protein
MLSGRSDSGSVEWFDLWSGIGQIDGSMVLSSARVKLDVSRITMSKDGRRTMLSSKSACMFLFLRRSRNQTNARMASRPTTPPTTPPAMAPTSAISLGLSQTKLHLLVPPPPEFAPPVETEATPDEVMICPSEPVMVVVLRVSRNF